MPKQHGYSPAQLMFGRSQQLLLPQPASLFVVCLLDKGRHIGQGERK